MSSKIQNLTAEQLFRMPDDGFRYELVKGELKKMTPAGFKHGAIVAGLTALLTRHVKENNLGVVSGAETGFKIGSNPDTVRAPDIAFVRRERLPPGGLPDTFWPGAPDLTVEILSPNDTVYNVEEKVADWLLAGAREFWVVNPKHALCASTAPMPRCRPSQGMTRLTDKTLFRLSAAEWLRSSHKKYSLP